MSRIGLALTVNAVLAFGHLASAESMTRSEILKRCVCADATACGTCRLPQCCAATAASEGGTVCVGGEIGEGACRDFRGPIQFSLALDGHGNLYAASNDTDAVFRITPGGCVTQILDAMGDGTTKVNGARGLSIDAQGNAYVANGPSGT